MRSHLQSALYRKAKAESGYRFWSLYGELTWAVNDPGVKGQPVLIRYADDFVILCGAGQGAALRERLERWLQGRGLELNKEKTRVADRGVIKSGIEVQSSESVPEGQDENSPAF